jgi:hypothetical protein
MRRVYDGDVLASLEATLFGKPGGLQRLSAVVLDESVE